MAHSYTPGLTVTDRTTLWKKRLLPLPGVVLVERGQTVDSTTVVARTELPGKVHVLNVVNQLSILPADIHDFMLKKEGDEIDRGDIIAEDNPFIVWLKTQVESPISGSIETISSVTGQVLVREKPVSLDVVAYLDGVIKEVIVEQGVVIESTCSLVQGIFGVGGEVWGPLVQATETSDEILRPTHITANMCGTVVFGGAYAGWDVLQKAKDRGLRGLVVGGIDAQDLNTLLGYDIGVAITGTEKIGFTLIVTEGFGVIPMAQKTFNLLSQHVGHKVSISGATQIRAGVIRPEIIIPLRQGEEQASLANEESTKSRDGIEIGDQIRVIREPYFGQIGKVISLPADLQTIQTESHVRVVEIEFQNTARITIPRANVEILEE
tara:strand:+ start:1820 stop:2956 length:1137 start_codon:yes stop_codon:yes gene_type:complete